MGLILFNGAPAHAGKISQLKERICSAALRPFQPPSLKELVTSAGGKRGLIAVRYYRAECATTMHFDESIGLLKITFAPNRSFRNRSLLSLMGGLALAYDGTEFYRAHSYDPGQPVRPMPPVVFTLNYSHTVPGIDAPPVLTRPRFGQGPVPKEPPLAPMWPTTHEYTNLTGMLARAERFVFVNSEAEINWLELQTTPAALRRLRKNLAAMQKSYGRQCTWPRILQRFIQP